MKGIDPKWIMWLGLVVTIEHGISGGTLSLTNMIPDAWIVTVKAWSSGLEFIGTAIMTWWAAVSSPQSGPLINTPLAPVSKAIIILAVVLSACLATGSAQAQLKTPGQIQQDINAALKRNAGTSTSTTALDSVATVLAKPFHDIADFIGADADAAVALSTAVPNIQDGHGQQCWIAMQSFGAIIKAHPIPITFHVINDYESLRLLGIATNNLCSNVHCTQVFADFTAMAQAASPMPLAIPSLHDLCIKVPQIAVVAPVTVSSAPIPTPSPSPTP